MEGHRVYVDTNIFVYFLDKSPEFFPVVGPVIERIASGGIVGVAGIAVMAEVLVKPYRTGDLFLVASIKSFFSQEGFLSIAHHDRETFDLAAQLRATKGLGFADALHVATAIRNGCRFFLTNDTRIVSSDLLMILRISELIGE